MIRLASHAVDRLASRGIASQDEVLQVCTRLERQIVQSQDWEVRVVVKTLAAAVYLPDGSNGDTVIACVDPRSRKVKTVMLQRSTQVARKRLEVTYLG